jgi:hypothetical protein
MKQPFIEKESYKHYYAKLILARWLHHAQKGRRRFDLCSFAGITWNKSRSGVCVEEKIYDDHGKLILVPDIILYSGLCDQIVFEVVHTCPVSNYKKKVYEDRFGGNWPIYEIDAEWILRQVAVPRKLKLRNLNPYWEGVPCDVSDDPKRLRQYA